MRHKAFWPMFPTGLLLPMATGTNDQVVVTFHGVRGSTPCSCPSQARYGGNTSCVTIEVAGQSPLVLDLGTGLRMWGKALSRETPIDAHALVTHLHWDHVQGLPFFAPLLHPETTLSVYGPGELDESIDEAFARFMAPPFFPVRSEQLPASVSFRDVRSGMMQIAGAEVMVRPVPHTGMTVGYRVTINGVVIAYVPDHQEPLDNPTFVAPEVLELCAGADILIHDAQLHRDSFAAKANWGHCTPEYALEVARQSGVESLVLFHHDPSHGDDFMDELVAEMQQLALGDSFSVTAAHEGLVLIRDAVDRDATVPAGAAS